MILFFENSTEGNKSMKNYLACIELKLTQTPVADPKGIQEVRSNPPPCPLFLNILFKWNNLV